MRAARFLLTLFVFELRKPLLDLAVICLQKGYGIGRLDLGDEALRLALVVIESR